MKAQRATEGSSQLVLSDLKGVVSDRLSTALTETPQAGRLGEQTLISRSSGAQQSNAVRCWGGGWCVLGHLPMSARGEGARGSVGLFRKDADPTHKGSVPVTYRLPGPGLRTPSYWGLEFQHVNVGEAGTETLSP